MDDIRMEADGGVPVFYPSWEQFKSFKEFIDKIEPIGMQTGIVKVVPPQEWLDKVPPIDDKLIQTQVKIKNPIEQEATGTRGIYNFSNMAKRRTYTLGQWRKYCDLHEPPKKRNSTPKSRSKSDLKLWQHDDSPFDKDRCAHLEAAYWKTLGFNAPVYGADVQGSLFQDLQEWNVANLDSLLNKLHIKIPGVNTSYIYCGSWKATFAWHLEDMDLHSINYIHFGAPKQWYSIPQADRHRFYEVMKAYWPRDQRKCKEFLRHKNYMVSPQVLEKEGVQVNKIIHRQNEFMITFPYGYHAGYNLGYNLAESVNFATDAWIPIGRASTPCKCADDNACFDVRTLLGEIPVMTPPEEPLSHKRPREQQQQQHQQQETLRYHEIKQPKIIRTGDCALCPHKWNNQYLPAGPKQVHAICAEFTPETWIQDNQVSGLESVPTARYALRCLECKVNTGACFQCDYQNCTRAFHPTCAASSGMITQNGTYLCRQHRPKYFVDPIPFATKLVANDPVQCRTPHGRIFAGHVVSNDQSESILTIHCYPNFDAEMEVPYDWVWPGRLEYIPRPPLVHKIKAKSKPKPKEPKEPKKTTIPNVPLATPIEPAEYKPEPYIPKNMHLYGVEGENGALESPFVFMGIPLPACLQRTNPL